MPLPINIDNLFRGAPVEWERLEFKAGWNPAAGLHAVCAFANDFHNLGGGYVVIGVETKDGRPVLPPRGSDTAAVDAIQKEILELGHLAIRPHYDPICVPHEIDGRTILVFVGAWRRDASLQGARGARQERQRVALLDVQGFKHGRRHRRG